MWICLVKMRAQPGKETALVRMCEEWMAGAPGKGCSSVELLLDAADRSLVALLERWESREQFETNAAREMADADLMARFQAVTAGAPEVQQFRPASVRSHD